MNVNIILCNVMMPSVLPIITMVQFVSKKFVFFPSFKNNHSASRKNYLENGFKNKDNNSNEKEYSIFTDISNLLNKGT